MMTNTELDMTVLEAMEFAPVCEYGLQTGRPGGLGCDNPAEWIYLALTSLECGCKMPDRFFCGPCKEWYDNGGRGSFYCTYCHACPIDIDRSTFRFERIDRSS